MFSFNLNKRDLLVILKIQKFFKGIGKISYYKNVVQYINSDLNNIDNIIIPHFDTYGLKGNKLYNYLIWKEIFNLVKTKTHLNVEGIQEIKKLKQKLNV